MHADAGEALFAAMQGPAQHALMEWSSVVLAAIVAILSFAHYRTSGDVIAPIIGLAFLASGIMDAFHTLAALRIVTATAPNTDFIPFTWALSRSFNALILVAGLLLSLRATTRPSRGGLREILVISGLFALSAYALIQLTALSPNLPQTQYPDAIITRPFDVFPLVVFVLATPLFWRLYVLRPSPLTSALLLALIPAIVLEAHMAFGSVSLFDSHFNIAHALKILEYLLPLLGLAAHYVRAHSDLIRVSEEAREASRAKSEFLANMSHEIRTPMNGVLGMLQALRQTDLSDKQREILKVVDESGETLVDIIDSILDLSKIESGRLEIDPHSFDMREIVDAVANIHRMKAEEKGLDFEVSIEPAAGGRFVGDSLRIRQLLHNLLSNAIKFTGKGSVSVHVDATPEDGNGRVRLVLTVRDTGIGLTKTAQAAIFDAFAQADSSTTRNYGGTGLGLAICRELCRLMGGSISVRSRAGRGAAFRIELPVTPCRDGVASPVECAAQAPSAVLAANRPTILVAEDVATNQLVLKALLAPLCEDLVIVGNGRQAVEAWETGRFDLVLMDIQMPGLDGLEATALIRAAERADPDAVHTPILALTANSMPHQVREYLDAGLDAHVPKPFTMDKLTAAIDQALGPRRRAAG